MRKTVRTAVESIEGYSSLETNYFDKNLKITASQGFDFDSVINKIENLGYPATRLDHPEFKKIQTKRR